MNLRFRQGTAAGRSLPGGGGSQLLAVVCDLRRLLPECVGSSRSDGMPMLRPAEVHKFFPKNCVPIVIQFEERIYFFLENFITFVAE